VRIPLGSYPSVEYPEALLDQLNHYWNSIKIVFLRGLRYHRCYKSTQKHHSFKNIRGVSFKHRVLLVATRSLAQPKRNLSSQLHSTKGFVYNITRRRYSFPHFSPPLHTCQNNMRKQPSVILSHPIPHDDNALYSPIRGDD
jgi:hypothetical protein